MAANSDILGPTQYQIFARMWAFAHLVHLLRDQREVLSTDIALIVCSFLVIWRPAFAKFMLAMVSFQILNVLQHLPFISNHWALVGFVNLSLLLGLWLQRDKPPHQGLSCAVPAIRWQVAVLYLYVVLHKLNADFLVPETSCAAVFYRAQAAAIPVLPQSVTMETITIWSTLGIEALIPIMLFLPRLRVPGAATAALFHYLIAANPHSNYYNFSAVLFPLFFLFVPGIYESTWRDKFRWFSDAFSTESGVGKRNQLLALTGFLAATGLGSLYSNPELLAATDSHLQAAIDIATYCCYTGILWCWVIFGTLMLGNFVLAIANETQATSPHRPLGSRLFLFPVLLMLFNGASPYLGLKSETSFAMYSNLRTEDGTNHLFIPDEAQITDYMRPVIEVEDSEHPVLQTYVDSGFGITPFMFNEIVQEPLARTVYRRDGVQHLIEVQDDIPEPHPWIASKLLGFRPVILGPTHCQH